MADSGRDYRQADRELAAEFARAGAWLANAGRFVGAANRTAMERCVLLDAPADGGLLAVSSPEPGAGRFAFAPADVAERIRADGMPERVVVPPAWSALLDGGTRSIRWSGSDAGFTLERIGYAYGDASKRNGVPWQAPTVATRFTAPLALTEAWPLTWPETMPATTQALTLDAVTVATIGKLAKAHGNPAERKTLTPLLRALKDCGDGATMHYSEADDGAIVVVAPDWSVLHILPAIGWRGHPWHKVAAWVLDGCPFRAKPEASKEGESDDTASD